MRNWGRARSKVSALVCWTCAAGSTQHRQRPKTNSLLPSASCVGAQRSHREHSRPILSILIRGFTGFGRTVESEDNGSRQAEIMLRSAGLGALVFGSFVAIDRYVCSAVNSYAAKSAANALSQAETSPSLVA